MFDYSKLRGRIVERYGTLGKFSRVIGVNPGWLSTMIAHGKPFRQDVIATIADTLEIRGRIDEYFFAEPVAKK